MTRRQKLKRALKNLTLTLAGGAGGMSASDVRAAIAQDKRKRKEEEKKKLLKKVFKNGKYYSTAECKKGYSTKQTEIGRRNGLNRCVPHKSTKKQLRKSRKARKPSQQALKKYFAECKKDNAGGLIYKCKRQSRYAKQQKQVVCCKRKPRKLSKEQRKLNKAKKLVANQNKKSTTKNRLRSARIKKKTQSQTKPTRERPNF